MRVSGWVLCAIHTRISSGSIFWFQENFWIWNVAVHEIWFDHLTHFSSQSPFVTESFSEFLGKFLRFYTWFSLLILSNFLLKMSRWINLRKIHPKWININISFLRKTCQLWYLFDVCSMYRTWIQSITIFWYTNFIYKIEDELSHFIIWNCNKIAFTSTHFIVQ